MIEIIFKNGEQAHWKKNEYTDYKYDGKCFIVIRDRQWIAFYNIDSIMCIEVE